MGREKGESGSSGENTGYMCGIEWKQADAE